MAESSGKLSKLIELPFSVKWVACDTQTKMWLGVRRYNDSPVNKVVWYNNGGDSQAVDLYHPNEFLGIDPSPDSDLDIYEYSPKNVTSTLTQIYRAEKLFDNPVSHATEEETRYSFANNGDYYLDFFGDQPFTLLTGFPDEWPDTRDVPLKWVTRGHTGYIGFFFGGLHVMAYVSGADGGDTRHYAGLFRYNGKDTWLNSWDLVYSWDLGLNRPTTGHIRVLYYRDKVSSQEVHAVLVAGEAAPTEGGAVVFLNIYLNNGHGQYCASSALNQWYNIEPNPAQTIDFGTSLWIDESDDPFQEEQMSPEFMYPGSGSVDGSAMWRLTTDNWNQFGSPEWVEDYPIFLGNKPWPQQGTTRWRREYQPGSSNEYKTYYGEWVDTNSSLEPIYHIGVWSDGIGWWVADGGGFREIRLFCFSVYNGSWDTDNWKYIDIPGGEGGGEINGPIALLRMNWPRATYDEGEDDPSGLVLVADCSPHDTSSPQSDVLYSIEAPLGCLHGDYSFDQVKGLYTCEQELPLVEANPLKHVRTDFWNGGDFAQRGFQVSRIDERVYLSRPYPGNPSVAVYIPPYDEPGIQEWLDLLEDKTDSLTETRGVPGLDLTHAV